MDSHYSVYTEFNVSLNFPKQGLRRSGDYGNIKHPASNSVKIYGSSKLFEESCCNTYLSTTYSNGNPSPGSVFHEEPMTIVGEILASFGHLTRLAVWTLTSLLLCVLLLSILNLVFPLMFLNISTLARKQKIRKKKNFF